MTSPIETLAANTLFEKYSFSASREAQELMIHLDTLGLLDWDAPMVADGRPFWHHLVATEKQAPVLLNHVLTRCPELLDQRNPQGETLWDAFWNKREALGHQKNESARNALDDSLCVVLAHAAPHHLGVTNEARFVLFRRVLALNTPKLMEAFQAHAPLDFDEAKRRQLWMGLVSSQWAVARAQVADLASPIALSDTVSRPFWRWVLDRGLASHVLRELETLPSNPERLEMKAWANLHALSARVKGAPMKSKSDLLDLVRKLPQALATTDDLGRPAAWFAIGRNPTLLKDLVAGKNTHPLLTMTDKAGHGLAYYLSCHLGHPSLARQDLSFLRSLVERPQVGFRVPLRGQGLLVQWFADPEQFAYGLTKVLPKWSEATQKDNARHPRNADILSSLLLGEGLWAMNDQEASAIAQTWARQPKWFAQLRNFVLPLWTDSAMGHTLRESPLAPHLPALICRWLLSGLAHQQASSATTSPGLSYSVLQAHDQRTWDACMGQPWVTTSLDPIQIAQEMEEMNQPENKPSPYLMNLVHAFNAKFREERTLGPVSEVPIQPRRRFRP